MRMIELYEPKKSTKAQQKKIVEIFKKHHCKLDGFKDDSTSYWVMNHPMGDVWERDAFYALKRTLTSGYTVFDVTEQFA
jgi:hypothetical protein